MELIVLCLIPFGVSIVWLVLHVRDYWLSRNLWNLVTVPFFVSGATLGIVCVLKALSCDFLAWWMPLAFAICFTFFGAIVRFILRLTNRVRLDKKKRSFRYRNWGKT